MRQAGDGGGRVWQPSNDRAGLARWRVWLAVPLGPRPRAGDALAWAAVWLVAGIFLQFGLAGKVTPFITLPAGVALLAMHARLHRRGRGARWLLPPAMALLGMALAAVRVGMQSTILLPAHVGGVVLQGVVEHVAPHRPGQARMVLRVRYISRVQRRFWPQRVRLTIVGLPRQGNARARLPLPGDEVKLRARLLRLPQPVSPGAWDPARDLYMRGIGATGFASLKHIDIRQGGCRDCGLLIRLERRLEEMRRAITSFIELHMHDAEAAALAQALIVGARGALPTELREHLRAAGLAHILAISGLHLALVAGAVFWLVRALLALFPTLALRWPLKKIAAISAWLTALGYLLLSGNSVATQRAFIMLSVALLALLADRPAISMRNLAIAALFIVLLWPHKALSAGFQMSFLAVMGLVATYEALSWWRARRMEDAQVPSGYSLPRRSMRRLLSGSGALVLTTIIASAFTALPAAWHFHRLPVHGLLGNMAALPVLSLLVMPAALLALALLPLGLAAWPLLVVEHGLAVILRAADAIAELPGGWWHVPALSTSATVLLAAGLLWLALRNDRARLLGLMPLVLVFSGLWPSHAPRPVLLVEERARLVAVRDATGNLAATPGRAGNFVLRLWLRRDGDAATAQQARARRAWSCSRSACRARLPNGAKVVYLRDVFRRQRGLDAQAHHRLANSMRAQCIGADVIIAAFPLRGLCGRRSDRLIIDRFDVWRHGAHAIYMNGNDGLHVVVTQASRQGLPWARPPLPRHEVLVPRQGVSGRYP